MINTNLKKLCWFLFFYSWICPSYVGAAISFAMALIIIINEYGFFYWRSLVITYALIIFVFHKVVTKQHYKKIRWFRR